MLLPGDPDAIEPWVREFGVLKDGCRTSLRRAYAMSGTDVAYAATSCKVEGLVSERELPGAYQPTRVLCDVRYFDRVWCYAMSGTELAYGDMRCPVLRCVRDRHFATALLQGGRFRRVWMAPSVLRAVRYYFITELSDPDLDPISFRYWHSICCYALTGVDYAAMHCAVLA
eukprot:3931947-Rhodomonas_salina.1